MIVNLHISLEGFDDGDFDTRNDYYKSNDDFFNAMRDESNRNAHLAYEVGNNLGNLVQKNTAHFNSTKFEYKAKSMSFSANDVVMLNENGNDETVDDFITDCVKDDVAVYTFKLNPDDIDPEFEEEYLSWVGEHNNIKGLFGRYSEDWIWANEPSRTFKIEFKNKANETKYAEMVNCKIIEMNMDNTYSCTILVERVNLIDKI